MNYSSSNTLSILDCIIHLILNYYIEEEKIIYILDNKVKPTYYTLYLAYSSYLSMSLDIFNSTIINNIHTSLHVLVQLNLEDLISNNQEKLLLLKTSSDFILDLVVYRDLHIGATGNLQTQS